MIKINRSKLMPKVLISLVVLVTILGITTSAKAGIPPFIWKYMQYNVISYGIDMDVPYDEPCLYLVATATTEEEIETGYWPEPPFKHKVFIDGEKINLRRFVFYDEYGSIFGFPETKWFVFYQVFEAGYFDIGIHDVRHEIWVQKPYAGADFYGWRIFVNYEGTPDYGLIGEPLIFSYNLNFY